MASPNMNPIIVKNLPLVKQLVSTYGAAYAAQVLSLKFDTEVSTAVVRHAINKYMITLPSKDTATSNIASLIHSSIN